LIYALKKFFLIQITIILGLLENRMGTLEVDEKVITNQNAKS
jgi:hypothetical protein